jgi:YVTN family beta-propeller protein
VIWLVLRYQDSVKQDTEFTPVFAVLTPSRPVADHLGFVTNTGSNTITVFDKSLDLVVAVIDTCAGPAGLAVDQRRRRVFVACSKDDEIQSIDGATGELIQRVRLSPGDQPRELGLTPDGATLVSVNPGSNSITFIDADPLTRQDRVNVGSGPNSVLIDAAGKRAFVFNTLSSSVSVIDLAGRKVAATLAMDASPLRGQFNATGARMYVIHERGSARVLPRSRSTSFAGSCVSAAATNPRSSSTTRTRCCPCIP